MRYTLLSVPTLVPHQDFVARLLGAFQTLFWMLNNRNICLDKRTIDQIVISRIVPPYSAIDSVLYNARPSWRGVQLYWTE